MNIFKKWVIWMERRKQLRLFGKPYQKKTTGAFGKSKSLK